jgi:effector-binding domain-containing protein
MNVIKFIVIAIALLAGVYFVIALLAPKTFFVQRKMVINAPPQKIFNEVNSFQNWESWSPWLMRDSTIKNIYTGPEKGTGNKVSWTSIKSESGSMEIMQSDSPGLMVSRITIKGFTPFQSRFTFSSVDSGTEVTWTDSGSFGLHWRPFIFFADKMIGGDLENGLKNLKKHVESMPSWKLEAFKIEQLSAQAVLSIIDSCAPSEIGSKLGALYGEIGGVMKKNKLNFTGPVGANYYSYSPNKVILEAIVPVSKEIKGEGRVKGKTMPETKALSVSFFGDYANIGQAMPQIMDYIKTNHLKQNGPEREIYITDPTKVKDKMQIETKINFPVK